MSSKDNNIMDKVSSSPDEGHLLVDVKQELRNTLKEKTKRYGSKSFIKRKTSVDPRTLRRVINGERIKRSSLETIVKWLISPDADVEDYIDEAL